MFAQLIFVIGVSSINVDKCFKTIYCMFYYLKPPQISSV